MVMGTETVAFEERRRQVAPGRLDPRDARGAAAGGSPAAASCPLSSGTAAPPSPSSARSPRRELFPGRDPVGQIVRVGDWRMRVIGVLASRGQQLGVDMDDVAIVPVATAMKMLNRRSLFRLLLQVRTHADLDRAKERVVRLIAERHGEEDVTGITQDAVLGAFTSILGALTLALAGIASVSLAVAGVGIMNVMLVSVSERTREIGLLKALGAGRRQILLAFLAEAVLLSTAGGLLGLLVGWLAVRAARRRLPRAPRDAAALGGRRRVLALGRGGRRLRRPARPPGHPARPRGGALGEVAGARPPPPRPGRPARPSPAVLPLHARDRDRRGRGHPAHLDRRGHARLHGVAVHPVRDEHPRHQPRQVEDARHPGRPRRHHAQAHHRRRRGARARPGRRDRGPRRDGPRPRRGGRARPQRDRARRHPRPPHPLALRGPPGLLLAAGRPAPRRSPRRARPQARARALRRDEAPSARSSASPAPASAWSGSCSPRAR